MDPLHHPDLSRLARRMRNRLEDTLDAEQHAAETARLRRRTMRDWLLEAEDGGDTLVLGAADGQLLRGTVLAVGADHVVLRVGVRQRLVSLSSIVWMEVRS